MMTRPQITFVVPTRNRSGQLLETLSRLRPSAGRLSHEIIVVDRAGSDGTAEAVAKRFPHVRLIELSADHEAAARNLGLSAAAADYVFMLDDGTWPQEGTAEFALRMMAQQPQLAAAVCRLRRPGESSRHEANGPAGLFAASGVVLRRRAVIEVGGYPIDASGFAEQYDLCARLWQAGWQVRHFEPMLAWRMPDVDGRDADTVLRILTATALRFWSRYAPQNHCRAMLDATIEQYRRVAEDASAVAGYREGLAVGLAAARRNRTRRRPLTDEQLAELFGPAGPPARRHEVPAGVPTAA
jgi:GT2 family glycosyltransferase